MNIEALAERVGLSVRSISSYEEAQLVDLPRAQRRTASFKKAVFVGGDVVYKGPYSAADAKLKRNVLHTALVALLERWLAAPVCTVRSFRELLKNNQGEYYLVSENLGEPSPQDFEIVTTKVESNVKVLRRGSFLSRLSELEGSGGALDDLLRQRSSLSKGAVAISPGPREPLLLPDVAWVACLQHLYVLYVLGIGDHGSHNVLLTKERQIVGIDLEELRSEKAPPTRLDALFKKVSARQRQLYTKYLPRISIFAHPLEGWQAETLAQLGVSAEELEDVQDQIAAFLLMPE